MLSHVSSTTSQRRATTSTAATAPSVRAEPLCEVVGAPSSAPALAAAASKDTLGASRAFAPEHLVLVLVALACVALPVPGFIALAAGVVFSIAFSAPAWSQRVGNHVLKGSVVALGAGIDLGLVLGVGLDGLCAAALTLGVAIGAGLVLARLLHIERDTALLITVGTAICGGSAIAAAAPVLRARPGAVGIAIGVVFLLNAVALVVFPILGDALGLSATAFGEWCALAIHDTSSVVGAAATHGAQALEIATVTKLARSLWIVPVCLALAFLAPPAATSASVDGARPRRVWPKPPLFVLAFVAAAALVALVPSLAPAGHVVASAGRRGLTLALFAIGLSIDRATLKQLSARHLGLGVGLWLVLGATALALVS